MIKYGLISETDGRTLEKTIDLFCEEAFPRHASINVLEIGVYAGETGNSIRDYIHFKKKRFPYLTGIDNSKDNEPLRYNYDRLIIGDSSEVYNQIEDGSQCIVFVDGCHCFAHVVSDFFCYADKVMVGGYIAFHDTSRHIKQFKDFQHGDKDNPDAYISVRKALTKIGLLGNGMAVGGSFVKSSCLYSLLDDFNLKKIDYLKHENEIMHPSWELVFDEADSENEAGGVCVFRKLY